MLKSILKNDNEKFSAAIQFETIKYVKKTNQECIPSYKELLQQNVTELYLQIKDNSEKTLQAYEKRE